MKVRRPPRRGPRHIVEAMLAARSRTTAFLEAVCGTSAATASFIGHDQQCEGGSPSSAAPSVQLGTSTQVRTGTRPWRLPGRTAGATPAGNHVRKALTPRCDLGSASG